MSGGWIDRLVSACVGLLVSALLVYCAVHLLQSVMRALIVVGGIIGLLALVLGTIVVFRTWRGRW